ncbi:inositol monophosphatase [Microbacterium sp. cx-55]|uniref:inositol monophosphatase family protein n=1 Tax=Microbacterium sp. cx-55 TaxID=2875948 RepID=UPI001CC02219|nr:inositol monophosphatase family protein [Microbacterium sp. cx-55]MBZ4487542.1 inositol monophosphatase [Microbacterium sp. cx-55]UGB35562.1 inositol monophosphatase [Microbacterium sp. cx-55]
MTTHTSYDPNALCDLAEIAARTAAPALLTAFRSEMSVAFKRDAHDVVTVHDKAAERVISTVLQRGVPGSEVLGEETGSSGDARLRWIVDPIDGTANFARGLAYWCISIAAELDGEVVAGAILDPVAGNMFAAADGGATLNGTPIRSASAADGRATLLTSFPTQHDVDLLGDGAFELLAQITRSYQHHHSTGSGALNLAHVAAGWSDATMGFDTHPWDVAAGAHILSRAGGTYTGFRGGVPANRPQHSLDYVATGAGGDHRALIDGVRDLSARWAPEAE